MNTNFNPVISEEMFAAWLDGNVSPAQDAYISQMCSVDPDMREIVAADSQVEEYYDHFTEEGYDLPDELVCDFDLPHIEDPVHEHIESYTDADVETYPGHSYHSSHDADDVYDETNHYHADSDYADHPDDSTDYYAENHDADSHGMDGFDDYDA